MYKMILQTIVLTLTMLSYGTADTKTVCSNKQLPVSKMVNSLGFRLEQMIENQENYFFSPLSISVSLAMVYIGARGTTREQMSEALEYDIVGKNCLPNKISESFRELIRSLQKEGDDNAFLIANGAFIQTGHQISHFYSSNLQKFFNSKAQFVDFAKKEVEAMNKINDWVANYTRGKISNMLNEPLDTLTIMVLLNAVYFKGFWDLPFNENITRNGPFYRIDNTTKEVQFMILQNQAYHYYDAVKKHFVLELDYVGGNISMILILPENNGLPNFDLKNEFLCEMRKKMEYKPLTIIMPKFNMEFKRELSKDMVKLGMSELFSDTPNLTGIREQNDLHLSLMVHKAVIEVNEKGSEASAFTGMVIDGRNKGYEVHEVFLADHPFLFYIIHRHTNTILFSGRLMDP